MNSDAIQWNTYGKPLVIHHHEVHLWRISLEQPPRVLGRLADMLCASEAQRAGSFYLQRDRDHWIVARSFLRILLSLYLRVPVNQLRFAVNIYGKPLLERDLQFNLSHSADLALYAFTNHRQIGVDIERIRPEVDFEKLMQCYFSPSEYQSLCMLPPAQRLHAFYRGWTSKEAYIKARGFGLSLGIDTFDVTLKPGEPAGLLSSKEDPREVTRWSLRELRPDTGYMGTLAVEGSDWNLSYWQWPGHFASDQE